MNRIIFGAAKWTMMLVAVFGILSTMGCKDDPDETPLVEDGFYIMGSATNYADFSNDATFAITRNEVTQENRNELMEIFIPIKGGSGGFSIVEVAGSAQTTYGPSADFANVDGGTNEQPNGTFQRGGFSESTTTFTVPSDGLYHVIIDTEVKKVVVMPVEYWGVIGGATPGGWGSDTQLASSGFNFDRMDFSASDIAMTLGDFKFRYGGGWKIEVDTGYVGDTFTGIKVNSNVGGSVAELIPGGDNISNTESGYYTATMTWIAGEGLSATVTRTGDLPSVDWTGIELGLIGDGLTVNGAAHDWATTIYLNAPTAAGAVYTYRFNGVTVNTAGGGFKIREGQTWDDTILGFNEVTMDGDGAADFDTNGDGNFIPLVDGASYDFTLVIDAATEVYTLTATKL